MITADFNFSTMAKVHDLVDIQIVAVISVAPTEHTNVNPKGDGKLIDDETHGFTPLLTHLSSL